jgi:hypothetical protein
MLIIPEESLQVHRVIASALSRHTFAMVQPAKRGVENQELATGVGVKWKGQYLLLTAGHVVDYCPKTRCDSFCLHAILNSPEPSRDSVRQISN